MTNLINYFDAVILANLWVDYNDRHEFDWQMCPSFVGIDDQLWRCEGALTQPTGSDIYRFLDEENFEFEYECTYPSRAFGSVFGKEGLAFRPSPSRGKVSPIRKGTPTKQDRLVLSKNLLISNMCHLENEFGLEWKIKYDPRNLKRNDFSMFWKS